MGKRGVSAQVPALGSRGYVVVDTETTGLHDPARVIEVGLVFLAPDGEIQESWSTLLRGDGHAGGKRLERIHGITDRQLRHAPEFAEIASGLEKAFRGRTLFAHNAGFDRARLNFEMSLAGRREIAKFPCTMRLGNSLGYGTLKLDDAIDMFGLERTNAHNAHDDALATAQLLQYYLATDKTEVREFLRRNNYA